LAEDQDRLARRQPLRPGRGHGLGGGNDTDYLAGNAVLDALVAETADNLRFHHAMSSTAKLRTFASFLYKADGWRRPRKMVARLECSLQPIAGETGMRQEVDIRYVVTSLEGSAQHLYENVYCQRGQMENLAIMRSGP
jgi:Transposase DDE domain group 1